MTSGVFALVNVSLCYYLDASSGINKRNGRGAPFASYTPRLSRSALQPTNGCYRKVKVQSDRQTSWHGLGTPNINFQDKNDIRTVLV